MVEKYIQALKKVVLFDELYLAGANTVQEMLYDYNQE